MFNCHTLHFIALQGPLDLPSAKEFRKYIGHTLTGSCLQPLCLTQWKGWGGCGFSYGHRCDSHCETDS